MTAYNPLNLPPYSCCWMVLLVFRPVSKTICCLCSHAFYCIPEQNTSAVMSTVALNDETMPSTIVRFPMRNSLPWYGTGAALYGKIVLSRTYNFVEWSFSAKSPHPLLAGNGCVGCAYLKKLANQSCTYAYAFIRVDHLNPTAASVQKPCR